MNSTDYSQIAVKTIKDNLVTGDIYFDGKTNKVVADTGLVNIVQSPGDIFGDSLYQKYHLTEDELVQLLKEHRPELLLY